MNTLEEKVFPGRRDGHFPQELAPDGSDRLQWISAADGLDGHDLLLGLLVEVVLVLKAVLDVDGIDGVAGLVVLDGVVERDCAE